MKLLCIEARAGAPWWPEVDAAASPADVEEWAADGAARLVSFVAERRGAFDRVLVATSGKGEAFRAKVDPTGYGAARAARAAAHPPAQWAALDGALADCRALGAVVVPAVALGATGGRGVASFYGHTEAMGEARDVLATVAEWQRTDAAVDFAGPFSLTLVSQRHAVAALVDDAAGVELLYYHRGAWSAVREADVLARHGCTGSALTEALVLAGIEGVGGEPRKGKPSTAAELALAHGGAMGAVTWAESVETTALPKGMRAGTVMALRAAGAGGREKLLRTMAVERLHVLPLNVAALMLPERMGRDGDDQDRVGRARLGGGGEGVAAEGRLQGGGAGDVRDERGRPHERQSDLRCVGDRGGAPDGERRHEAVAPCTTCGSLAGTPPNGCPACAVGNQPRRDPPQPQAVQPAPVAPTVTEERPMTTQNPETVPHDATTGEVAEAPPPPVETAADAAARAAEWAKTPTLAALAAAPPAEVIGIDPSQALWALSLQPRDPAEAMKMARAFHAGGLYAKKFNSPEAIWTVILLGREHGLSALAALQSMTIIDGKVEMDAALIVAKILRSGLANYFSLVETDDAHATWETHRIGEKSPLRMTFTVMEAERREIFRVNPQTKRRETFNGKTSQWQKMPDVMCMWRAATKLARAKYSDVVRGLYGQGEIRETLAVPDDMLDAAAAKVGLPVPVEAQGPRGRAA